ncbi:MAG TPA: NYN domain-containing protein [Bacillota bacterium]|nr:NYN domain-containing protein [Bacillota bacterium]
MTSRITEFKHGQKNTVVYVDYENIAELLRQSGNDPLEIDFFRVIQGKLRAANLNIIDFIVYSNFEKSRTRASWNTRQQSYIRTLGLQTRQASNNGKNSGDLELTVDALRVLYKTPSIHVFVIISSDRDIIPLLKAIKYENKFSYVISTRNGFNQVVAEYADAHEYIEDIFQISATPCNNGATEVDPEDLGVSFDPATVTVEEVERAREVAHYLYTSQIWKRANQIDEPVSLSGYISVISRVINRFPADLLNDFKRAHCLKYVAIYQDQNKRLYLRQGERAEEVMNET